MLAVACGCADNDRPVTSQANWAFSTLARASLLRSTLGLRKGESEIPNIITKVGPTTISNFRSSERYVVFPQTKSESGFRFGLGKNPSVLHSANLLAPESAQGKHTCLKRCEIILHCFIPYNNT